ncbi:MAG: PDZ domain-containing protein [Planctomycetota bacterium]|jgi:hypothetical protein
MRVLVAAVVLLLLVGGDDRWPPTDKAKSGLKTLKNKYPSSKGYKHAAFGYIAHACKSSDRWFKRSNKFLETYAKWARKTLFGKDPAILYVMSFEKADDFYKFAGRRGISGYYSPGKKQLVNNLHDGLGTCSHEMTHALHFADWPGSGGNWLQEGLGALMENSLRKSDGTFIGPGFSHWRFPGVRRAIRSDSISLSGIMKKRGVQHGYSQGRWITTYLMYKGKLKEFYDQYKKTIKSDRSGIKAMEKVLGKSIGKIDKEWKEWSKDLEVEIVSIRSSKLHPVLGIVGRNKSKGLEIGAVSPKSSADEAGLKEGDVILKAGGKSAKTMKALLGILVGKKEGSKLKVSYLRRGKEETVTVTLDQFIDG